MPSARCDVEVPASCRRWRLTGVPASTSARTLGSFSTGFFAKRVAPKAVSLACLSFRLSRPREELLVLGVGHRPAALDVVDTQFVQLLGDERACRPPRRRRLRPACRRGAWCRRSRSAWIVSMQAAEVRRSLIRLRVRLLPSSSSRKVIISRSSRAHGFDRLVFAALRAWPGSSSGRSCSRRSTPWRIAPDWISARIFFISARVCVVDDARAAGVVAILGGVGDGVAHVAQAALIDQVDDELQFVQALEVGDFGGVAGFDQGLEAGADQFADAAAEHGLLAEQVAFGLFLEGGLDHAGLAGSRVPSA